jgi:hypothetical protein
MADEWYYTNNGQQQGPVTTAALKQLAATQRLQPGDLVWREGLATWVPARSAKGLFAEAPTVGYSAEAAAAPAPTPVAPLPEEDEPAAEPRPPRRRADEDRPRRRRAEDDDEDEDRPRRRRAARSNKGLIIGLVAGGAGLLVLLVVVVLLVVLLGSGAGSGSYTVNLAPWTQPGCQHERTVYFKGGEAVEIRVTSDKNTHLPDTDVDLYVLGPNGALVALDERIDADCYVRFVPAQSGNYVLRILNRGSVPNRSRVTYK